tara:strand:- start:220 stop:549 length:330 start_codon:yes stop_codon:yes gene_type:complete
MGFLNLSSSLRYGPHGKKRKTKAFTKKKTKYNELLLEQQKIYDQVVREVAEEYPSLESTATGNCTPRKEPLQYTGERKLLGIAAMHKSNLVPVFEEDKDYAKDLARMRR